MEQNKAQQKQSNKKRQYKKYRVPHKQEYITTDYAVINKDTILIGTFRTLKEAIELQQTNEQSIIYILKVYKLQ